MDVSENVFKLWPNHIINNDKGEKGQWIWINET